MPVNRRWQQPGSRVKDIGTGSSSIVFVHSPSTARAIDPLIELSAIPDGTLVAAGKSGGGEIPELRPARFYGGDGSAGQKHRYPGGWPGYRLGRIEGRYGWTCRMPGTIGPNGGGGQRSMTGVIGTWGINPVTGEGESGIGNTPPGGVDHQKRGGPTSGGSPETADMTRGETVGVSPKRADGGASSRSSVQISRLAMAPGSGWGVLKTSGPGSVSFMGVLGL